MIQTKVPQNETVGIASIGRYIPPGILTSAEMARRSGIPLAVFLEKIGMEQKHVAAEEEHPSEMGIRAARDAVKRAGIDPREIDVLVYCGAGFYDCRIWSPSARIQSALGAENCYAFEIKNGCNGGNLGINVCKNLLLGDPDKKYALVVCSEKLSISIDYTDPQRPIPLHGRGWGCSRHPQKRRSYKSAFVLLLADRRRDRRLCQGAFRWDEMPERASDLR